MLLCREYCYLAPGRIAVHFSGDDTEFQGVSGIAPIRNHQEALQPCDSSTSEGIVREGEIYVDIVCASRFGLRTMTVTGEMKATFCMLYMATGPRPAGCMHILLLR